VAVLKYLRKTAKQDAVQKTRASQHSYSLEEFGLSAARIRKDLAYVYQAYGLD
jgi:hypothetical protein